MSRRATTRRAQRPREGVLQEWDRKFDLALESMANGEALSIQKACKLHHVSHSRLYAEMRVQPKLAEKYAQAKQDSLKALAEETIDISDDEDQDVQRSRLRVDTRKWLLAKLMPRTYGDKQQVEHSGEMRVVRVDADDEAAL